MKLALVQGERVWTKPLSDDAKAKASRERQAAKDAEKARRRELIDRAKAAKRIKVSKSRNKPNSKRSKPLPLHPVVAYAPGMGKEFYYTREWRLVRYQALELHGTSCLCCGASRQRGAVIHVDHIKPRSLFPELELTLDNLQILCEDCNVGKSNTSIKDWR